MLTYEYFFILNTKLAIFTSGANAFGLHCMSARQKQAERARERALTYTNSSNTKCPPAASSLSLQSIMSLH